MKRLRWWRKPKNRSDKADLGRYFAALRKQAPKDSFPAVQDWLTGIEIDAQAKRQHHRMPLSPMKVFLNTYRTRLVISSFILAVTFISCTTPVEHEETIGHMVSGIIEGTHAPTATSQLSKLDWIQPNQLELGLVASKVLHEVNKHESDVILSPSSADHRFIIALPQTGETQANAWAYDLKLIEGIRDVEVTPLHVTSEKPVYKVVLNSFMDKKSNAEFRPDQDQYNRAIGEYLERFEMHGVEVKQIQDENGNIVLSLTPPAGLNKSGLSTLKRFISEVQPRNEQARNSTEDLQVTLKKYKEIESEVAQMEAGREREKMEMYLKQLEAKLDALHEAEKN